MKVLPPARIIRIEFTQRQFSAFLAVGLLTAFAAEVGSESLTMTTYYPAPVGIYNVLTSVAQTTLARDGDETLDGPGNGNTVGIGMTNDPLYMLSVNGTINAKAFMKDGKPFGGAWEEKAGMLENTNPGPVTIKDNGAGGMGQAALVVDGTASGSGHPLWIKGAFQNEIVLVTPAAVPWEIGLETPDFFIIHTAGSSWGLNRKSDMFVGVSEPGRIIMRADDGKCYAYKALAGGALSAGAVVACGG